jgi:L-fuconolactonase
MVIVDSQVHIWAADTPSRPWPPGKADRAHRPVPLSREEVLGEMDAAGVARAILGPPSWEGDRNDLSLEAARLNPDRFGVMGRLTLTDPASEQQLRNFRDQPGMLGFRFTFHREDQKPWLTNGAADWLWPAAEQAQVPLMIMPTGSLPLIAEISERYPQLRLIIDHLALSSKRRDAECFADIPALLPLARCPNVAVKVSALPTYTTEAYPFQGIHKYIRQVYDAFGPERMFWGSDVSRLRCSYRECITLFTEELDWLTDADKASIMGGGISKWLNWPL